jgi:WD40 repeat protein
MKTVQVLAVVALMGMSLSAQDKPSVKLDVASPLTTTALCSDGSGVIGAAKDGFIYAWELPSGKAARRIDLQKEKITDLSCSRKLIAVGTANGAALLVDRSSGAVTKRMQIGSTGIKVIRIAPDSSFLAVAPLLAQAQLWSTDTGKRISMLPNEFGAAWTVAVSSDSERIATGDEDTTVRIYDRTGKLIAKNDDLLIEMFAVDFFNSKELAVAGADGSVRVLDVATGKMLRKTKADSDVIFELAASPDGKSVCALYLDNVSLRPTKLQVWDTQTAMLLKTIDPKDIIGGGTVKEGMVLIKSDGERSASVIAVP